MLSDGYHDIADTKLAVVVTHLEMRAKAGIRPLPLPNGIILRRIETPSIDWYRDIFSRVGDNWLWVSRTLLSEADLGAIIHDPAVHIWTLTKDGQDEALLELDFRTSNECELAFFGLTENLIGTGAGRVLMNTAIQAAWEQPINRFHVHTCTGDSQHAMKFYTDSGFTPTNRQVEVFDDPRLNQGWDKSLAPHIPVI